MPTRVASLSTKEPMSLHLLRVTAAANHQACLARLHMLKLCHLLLLLLLLQAAAMIALGHLET